jgi:hypothetical protein
VSFLDRILGRGAADREHEPGSEGAPQEGTQTDEYRTADPRDVVEAGGTLMAGPGGAPQDAGPADHPGAADLQEPEEQE